MADLSGLTLKQLDPVDWENYPVGGEPMGPPHDEGKYYGKYTKLASIKAKDGFLIMEVHGEIVDPDIGRETSIRDWLMTAPRDKGRRAGTSKAGDFLVACGSSDTPGTDQQEWADAVERALDVPFPFFLGWSAYDAEAEKEVARRMSDFPSDGNGGHLPYIEVTRPDNSTARISGRQRVAFYLKDDEG